MLYRTVIAVFLFLFTAVSFAYAEKWAGVDDAVVGRVAGEHGRHSRPLLDLEGDAQLFAFLMAGVTGGFAAGYWWRSLSDGRRKREGKPGT